MAKFKPGIPDNFELNVEPVSDLRDYLDEPSLTPQRRARSMIEEAGEGRESKSSVAVEASPPASTARDLASQTLAVQRTVPVIPHLPETDSADHREPAVVPREDRIIAQTPHPPFPRETSENEDRIPRVKAPRREISMTPEAFRMSDELLEAIRSGSGQRDTAAKELIHALILLAHEAIDEIDPHSIPKRGRWGTPTARAYPLELKNAIWKALLKKSGTSPNGPLDLD